MKTFESYFNEEAIISYICKLRVKLAKSRNKKHLIHLLTDSEKFNYHVNDAKKYYETSIEESNEFIRYEGKYLLELNKILPSRKKWVILSKYSRTDKRTHHPISSNDRNYYSLIKTIKHFRKTKPSEPWLIELDNFIKDIQDSIISSNYTITSPVVYPKLKDDIKRKGENKCRPISLFTLKDRVILSLTNKYLTVLFDRYFEDSSFAFRSKKNKSNTATLSHHDCITEILDYRKINENNDLWVVECDMEKFYDSVNHTIIRNLFASLIEKAKNEFPELNFKYPSHIFSEFLKCYSFNTNVLPLNHDSKYWEEYRIPNGEFGWVNKQFEKLNYYSNINSERIGIPQGGALSGLIANIVLDVADKEVKKTNVFYTRFCDDMIIIHTEQDECNKAKEIYFDCLKSLKLVPHDFSSDFKKERRRTRKILPPITFEQFWKQKSKAPYKWASVENDGFPWIGFVGYEMHYEGFIRVRKKSLAKELKKQKEIIDEIRKAIKENRRKSIGSVSESAINRLVGMSVGRVTLKNFDTIENELCWKNGFKELFMNKYSLKQIKQLDRNRSKLYYKLKSDLEKLKIDEKESDELPSKKRQVIHFNKPFSYFYQVLEKRRTKESSVE